MAVQHHHPRLPHISHPGSPPAWVLPIVAAIFALAIVVVVAFEGFAGGSGETQQDRDNAFFDSQQHSLIGADGGGTEAAKGQR